MRRRRRMNYEDIPEMDYVDNDMDVRGEPPGGYDRISGRRRERDYSGNSAAMEFINRIKRSRAERNRSGGITLDINEEDRIGLGENDYNPETDVSMRPPRRRNIDENNMPNSEMLRKFLRAWSMR